MATKKIIGEHTIAAASEIFKNVAKESKGFALKETIPTVKEVISKNKEHISQNAFPALNLLDLITENSKAQTISLSENSIDPVHIADILADGFKHQSQSVFSHSKSKIVALGSTVFTPVSLGIVGIVFTIGSLVHFGPKVKKFFQRKFDEKEEKRILAKFNLDLKDLDIIYAKSNGSFRALKIFVDASLEDLLEPDEKLNLSDLMSIKFSKFFLSNYKKKFFEKMQEIQEPELKKNVEFVKYSVVKEIAIETAKISMFSKNHLHCLDEAKDFLLHKSYLSDKIVQSHAALKDENEEVAGQLDTSESISHPNQQNELIQFLGLDTEKSIETIPMETLFELILRKNFQKAKEFDDKLYNSDEWQTLTKEFDFLLDQLNDFIQKNSHIPEKKQKIDALQKAISNILKLKGGKRNSKDRKTDSKDEKTDPKGRKMDSKGYLNKDYGLDTTFLELADNPFQNDWRFDALRRADDPFKRLKVFLTTTPHNVNALKALEQITSSSILRHKEYEYVSKIGSAEDVERWKKQVSSDNQKIFDEAESFLATLNIDSKSDLEKLNQKEKESILNNLIPKIEKLILECLNEIISARIELLNSYSNKINEKVESVEFEKLVAYTNSKEKLESLRKRISELLTGDTKDGVCYVTHPDEDPKD